MDVICPRCRSRHQVDPPGARGRARSLKFRCSDCGHTFPVSPETPHAAPPALLPEEPPSRLGADYQAPLPGETVTMLRQDSTIFHVPDQATMQRWILEQRVRRDDMVSNRGLRWVSVTDRADLALFFAAAEKLPGAQAPTLSPVVSPLSTTLSPAEATIDATAPVEADAPPTEVAPPPGAFVEAHEPVDEEPATLSADELPVPGDRTVPFGADPDTQEATIEARAASTAGWGIEPEPTAALGRAPSPSAAPRAEPEEIAPTAEVDLPRLSPPALAPSSSPPSLHPFLDGNPMVTVTPRQPDDVFAEPPREGRGPMPLILGGVAVLGVVLVGGAWWAGEQQRQRAPAVEAERARQAAIQSAEMDAAAASAAVPPAAKAVPVERAESAGHADEPPAEATAPATEPPPAPAAAFAEVEPAPASTRAPAKPPGRRAEPAARSAPEPVARRASEARQEPSPSAPNPKPAAAAGGSAKGFTDAGWKAIDKGQYAQAQDQFAKALDRNPASAWALYGRGYAAEKLGDGVSAKVDYCDALALGGDTELTRELDGGLRRLGARCE